MACPLFEPTERLDWQGWSGRFRPPLGAPHAGLCHAGLSHAGSCHAASPVDAPAALLLDGCNMGYARGLCAKLPAAEADAFRLEVARLDADAVEIDWLLEKDCLPLRHGRARLDRASGLWCGQPSDAPLLLRQLQAFAAVLLDPQP
ncbi:MAG: hypothetical protein GC160_24880 [Acidobacteria bacterium]|nr:hypothetical protein [Acidobacteriota bacterium]